MKTVVAKIAKALRIAPAEPDLGQHGMGSIDDLRALLLNSRKPLTGYRVATGKHSKGRKGHRGHRVFVNRPAVPAGDA